MFAKNLPEIANVIKPAQRRHFSERLVCCAEFARLASTAVSNITLLTKIKNV
ncbi:hypothetical protein AC26_4256 [Escherichia coli 1-176-05_S3_C2]|nr:hypothetical protein AC26_4256 [Escherichia coli 1-176-05_S3_C2]